MRHLPISCLYLSLLTLPLASFAEVVPNRLFSDHCVLQRGAPVPVWGSAEPGEMVTVEFRGQEASATADRRGHWSVDMDPGPAGGPFELVIRGEDEIRISDVMVGEVWICSGQSNMEWTLGGHGNSTTILNGQAAAARADYPMLRHFRVSRSTQRTPQDQPLGEWTICTPETAPAMTAVGFFFGRELMEHLDVPIGLIHSSWGGTPAQAWTSLEEVSKFPRFARELARMESFEKEPGRYLQLFEEWAAVNDYGSRPGQEWFAPGLDTTEWETIKVPGYWESQCAPGFDGIAWYRTQFELPEGWEGRELVLVLGPIDDLDTTWINGQRIGFTSGYYKNRSYALSPGLLKPGLNELAVRVVDTGGQGGICFGNPQLTGVRLYLGSESDSSVSLDGTWHFRTSTSFTELTRMPAGRANHQNEPAMLFNGMLAPLIPFGMRGVIWYQGEANARNAAEYQHLFPAMINDWRGRWKQKFPFLFVQIAPYKGQPPEIREAQLLTSKGVPNTAMAVTIDLGDPDNIHPANKQPVGERLALAARALAYGEDIVYSGPVYESVEFTGDQAVLHFSSVGSGLVAGGDRELRGFTMAGDDGMFHPARADISGDTVVVTCDEVADPVAVRYGWANVADGNLYNRDGLPASPFRTEVPALEPLDVDYELISRDQADKLRAVRDSIVSIENLDTLYEDRVHSNGLPYHVYVPENLEPGKAYPMVVFLHGHSDLTLGIHNGFPKGVWSLPEIQAAHPHILFVPRHRELADHWIHEDYREMTIEAMDDFIAELNADPDRPSVDESRLYLTGFSKGGMGTWNFVLNCPDKFAAVAPLSGFFEGPQTPSQAESIKHVPIWIFNGDGDRGVTGSRISYLLLNDAGAADVRYHEYVDQGHVIDDFAYFTPGFLDWFLAQRLP